MDVPVCNPLKTNQVQLCCRLDLLTSEYQSPIISWLYSEPSSHPWLSSQRYFQQVNFKTHLQLSSKMNPGADSSPGPKWEISKIRDILGVDALLCALRRLQKSFRTEFIRMIKEVLVVIDSPSVEEDDTLLGNTVVLVLSGQKAMSEQ